MPKPQWTQSGPKLKFFQRGKERDIKVRSRPSAAQERKDNSLRKFDGSLSLEEGRICQVLPKIQGGQLCSGGTTSKTKKDAEQYLQSNMLQRVR